MTPQLAQDKNWTELDLSVGSTPNPIATQKASPTDQSKTGFLTL